VVTSARLDLAVLALTFGACARDSAPPPEPPAGMVFVPGGSFEMGTNSGAGFEGPAHEQEVAAFFLDRTEVTNEAFAGFVAATGHVTAAETHGSSAVFDAAHGEWHVVDGATWRHPEGPASTVEDRARHPVVHVAWSDANAFCAWRGARLPGEAEWERAARGTRRGARFPWGNEPTLAGGRAAANTWQGQFPREDLGADGFRGTAPVASYPPTGYGLYDMAGNVWEWTADWFDRNARERAIRGGSWLCAEGHCIGYRVAARGHAFPDEPTNHLGFRCALSAD
jgi:sulfatase modifying factor 1